MAEDQKRSPKPFLPFGHIGSSVEVEEEAQNDQEIVQIPYNKESNVDGSQAFRS